ncbi:MAG: hypothetical protein IH600_00695 [Bacteroidetes bacterium]|nr:hypothetical protein [Bacteroidota bacterium]
MKNLTLILTILPMLLPSLNLEAQPSIPFRAGLQVGMAAERSSYTWMGSGDAKTTLDVEAQQNGFLGLTFDFVLSGQLLLEFGPHYGQRNVPIATLQRLGGVNFTLRQDPVDYLGIPVILKVLPFVDGLVLPYFGAGMEFGMNLSSLHVSIDEFRIAEEPPFSRTISRTRNLNQLYSSVLAEAGIDIHASADWSVLLGVRYSQELTPLLEDPLLTWETPHNWKVRFAVLYTFGEGL